MTYTISFGSDFVCEFISTLERPVDYKSIPRVFRVYTKRFGADLSSFSDDDIKNGIKSAIKANEAIVAPCIVLTLMQACNSRNVDFVRRILMNDPVSQVRYCNDYGITPLMVACINGYDEIVALLLQHVPDDQIFVATVPEGWTPLMIACFHNHVPVVRALAKHKMCEQCLMKSSAGETAMSIAMGLQHEMCFQIMKMFMIKSELIDYQAEVMIKSED